MISSLLSLFVYIFVYINKIHTLQITKISNKLAKYFSFSRDDQASFIHIKKSTLNYTKLLGFSLEKFNFRAKTKSALNAYTDILFCTGCVHFCAHRLVCALGVFQFSSINFIKENILGAGYGRQLQNG